MNRSETLNFLTIQEQNDNLTALAQDYYRRAGELIVDDRSLKVWGREEDAELLLEVTAGLVDENDRWVWDMVGDVRMPHVGQYGFDVTTQAA